MHHDHRGDGAAVYSIHFSSASDPGNPHGSLPVVLPPIGPLEIRYGTVMGAGRHLVRSFVLPVRGAPAQQNKLHYFKFRSVTPF
jgi:hypothetical protein